MWSLTLLSGVNALPPVDKVNFTSAFLAVGDWGTTDDINHTSATDGHGPVDRGYDAQVNIAKQMTRWAQKYHPAFLLNHGDAFYWTGVNSVNDPRWKTLYEDVYTDPSLYIPWYGVMGNHDYGGGSGFCGPSGWNAGELCPNVAEMEKALSNKFNAQRDYKGPHNRWRMPDHYYKVRYIDPATGVTVDVFNFDGNAAVYPLLEICCQCISTGQKNATAACETPVVGQSTCVRGDVAQYKRCEDMLTGWFSSALFEMKADLSVSNATWKIVHNHYPLKFYSSQQQKELTEMMRLRGVHVFIAGHEHGEGHDISTDGVHHLFNGGGGGSEARRSSAKWWGIRSFGFIGFRVSPYYLQVVYYSDYGAIDHCYNIPVDRSDHDPSKFLCPPSTLPTL